MHWRSFETETAGLASCNNQPVDLMSVIPKRKNRRWLPHEISICMRILSRRRSHVATHGRWAQMARGQMSGACRAGPTGSAWPESSIINLEHTEWPPRTAPSPTGEGRTGPARPGRRAGVARGPRRRRSSAAATAAGKEGEFWQQACRGGERRRETARGKGVIRDPQVHQAVLPGHGGKICLKRP
jgi:hypothetical protein